MPDSGPVLSEKAIQLHAQLHETLCLLFKLVEAIAQATL